MGAEVDYSPSLSLLEYVALAIMLYMLYYRDRKKLATVRSVFIMQARLLKDEKGELVLLCANGNKVYPRQSRDR